MVGRGEVSEIFLESISGRLYDFASQLTDDGTDNPATVAFLQEAFAAIFLEDLAELGQVEDPELCHFEQKVGRGVGRVLAYEVFEEEGRIDLVTTIWNGFARPGKVGKNEVVRAIKQSVLVYQAAIGKFHREMEPASAAFDMMEHIYNARNSTQRVRVVVLVDGFAPQIDKVDLPGTGFELTADIWDLQRWERASDSGLSYEAVEIDFIERQKRPVPCLPVKIENADYEACLAVFSGDLLYDLYHEFGSRLLELNVRSFLQARGKVNRGIRDTLKEDPTRFMAYNNGISATAEDIEYVKGVDGLAIRRLKGLQIVNGGQTVASIHRAKQNDKADLGDVKVQAKITIVRPELIDEIVPKVSRYANTQNKVNEADFSANHPVHVRLQQLSSQIWAPGEQTRWFYERARGQYEVARNREGSTPARKREFDKRTPKSQRFNKVQLAKFVNSWNLLPHVVSRGGQKNFVGFMQLLANMFPKNWEPDADFFRNTVAQAIIFKSTERLARRQRIPAYRANAVTYTVALISYRTAGRVDLAKVWQTQNISAALEENIDDWLPNVHRALIDTSGGRNVTEWCKKEECWREIQTLSLPLSQELEVELSEGQALPTVGAVGGKQGTSLTAEDKHNLAKVMQISAEEWLHISGWGAKTGHLKDWQSGIAATLATYAAQGWLKVPSAKQARHAVSILEVADDEGGRPSKFDDY